MKKKGGSNSIDLNIYFSFNDINDNKDKTIKLFYDYNKEYYYGYTSGNF